MGLSALGLARTGASGFQTLRFARLKRSGFRGTRALGLARTGASGFWTLRFARLRRLGFCGKRQLLVSTGEGDQAG